MKRSIVLAILFVVVISACAPLPVEEGVDPWDDDNSSDAGINESGEAQDSDGAMAEKEEEQQDDSIEEEQDEEIDDKEIIEDLTDDTDDSVPDTKTDDRFTLRAEKKEDTVELSWDKYEGDNFKYYKVVRSVVDATPTYKEEGYIETIPDINMTDYTDINPDVGINYYAVTAVTNLNKMTDSNPVKIEFPNPYETPDQEIELSAELTDGGVMLTWEPYEGKFFQYKIVRTTKHPYPKYPDDDLIETIPFVNKTQYVDRLAEPGTNYYAVTIIRPDRSRFTSRRASVEVKI